MGEGASAGPVVEGPLWSSCGLGLKAGRYPLAVEAPVTAMADMLVPGVSTLTRFVRYYSLYWSIAALAEQHGLGREECRQVVRCSEAALALASLIEDPPLQRAHGADKVLGLPDDADFATVVSGYSPRVWGFWSQYNGPSKALGTTRTEGGALRPGRRACPDEVMSMFRPLHDIAGRPGATIEEVAELGSLAMRQQDTADVEPLRELFTATRDGRHDPDEWTGDDRTRRATLRLVVRAAQLHPGGLQDQAVHAFRHTLAYGGAAERDPVLSGIEQTAAWRGVLLRNYSVGAWRRLWADLVAHVQERELATREDLHEWITAALPSGTVAEFEASLPSITDRDGFPLPAEEQVRDVLHGVRAEIAVLLLGARRPDALPPEVRVGFFGRGGRRQFLNPLWVAARAHEYRVRPIADLGRVLVDDMLAQARRVALRKVRIGKAGEMTLFARLHERDGVYFAQSAEGQGDVGLRLDQLVGLARQLGLLDPAGRVTPVGEQLLDVRG